MTDNKNFVLTAFDTLFNKRDYEAAARFWSPDYIQHSAHIPPGRDGLFNLVRAAPPDMRYENHVTVADGDYVLLHGRFTNSGRARAWVAGDVVRLENGLLIEHWDTLQDEVTQDESKSGLPMFGDRFPTAEPALTVERASKIVAPLYEALNQPLKRASAPFSRPMSSTKTASSTTAPTEFLQVNGQSYAYRRFGNGPGLPLLFRRSVIRQRAASSLASSVTGIAGEERAAVVDFRDAASERCPLLHLREHVCEEQHLAVARSSDERVFDIARVLDHKPRIFDAVLTAQTFEVALPALAVRRIRKDEVEFSRGERVIGQSRVLGTADDVVSRIAFALYKQIGFTDGVRLRVDLLRSRSVNFDVL